MSHLLVAGTAPLRAPLELGEYHTAACTALFHHLLLPHWPEGGDQILSVFALGKLFELWARHVSKLLNGVIVPPA